MRKTFIISECGINSMGNYSNASEQIFKSKEAGADAVKFQIYKTRVLYRPDFKYYKDAERGEYSYGEHRSLATYAELLHIEWFASPFHLDAVELMESLNVKRYKVASPSVKNLELLRAIGHTNKPVIMSVGGASESDIESAIRAIGHERITLLYCISKYPSKTSDFKFSDMVSLGSRFSLPFGFSSHCPYISPTIEAVKLGASVIEHHTTTSRELEGCDQSSSLEYEEFGTLVNSIRTFETSKGTDIFCGTREWSKEVASKFVGKYISDKSALNLNNLEYKFGKINHIYFLHWGWTVPKHVIDRYFCVGFHPSDLPKFRGEFPIENQIRLGINKTKLTAYRMNDKPYQGNILVQNDLTLDGSMYDIHNNMITISSHMIDKINSGSFKEREQEGEPSYYTREDAGVYT